jgi:hypothetical protein
MLLNFGLWMLFIAIIVFGVESIIRTYFKERIKLERFMYQKAVDFEEALLRLRNNKYKGSDRAVMNAAANSELKND